MPATQAREAAMSHLHRPSAELAIDTLRCANAPDGSIKD